MITTLIDTKNCKISKISKNSKRILFIVLGLYWSSPEACILHLLLQFNFVAVNNVAYYIICPICWYHCIPYQHCNLVRSSGSFGSYFVRLKVGHTYMPDLDQN